MVHAYADVCQKPEIALKGGQPLVPCKACSTHRYMGISGHLLTDRGPGDSRESTVMRYAWSLPSTPFGRMLSTSGLDCVKSMYLHQCL